jgi:hypothetical protein
MRGSKGFWLALTLVATGPLFATDVWRWTDPQGRVHYSDVPVDGAVRVQSSKVRPAGASNSPSPSSAGPAVPATLVGAQRASDQLASEASSRGVQQDVLKKRAEQCNAAKEIYERMISAQRVYKPGANGERTYLTDAELSEARVKARLERDSACSPAAR